MKHVYLILAVIFLSACAKEDLIGPAKLKNGQEVEVLVSDRYGAIEDPLLLLPSNKPAGMSLAGFSEREPGYTYRVRAKVVRPAEPLQDAPSYWLEFVKVITKEKVTVAVPFDLALIQTIVPGGPFIRLRKEGGKYYLDDKVMLTAANNQVNDQLEEILAFNNYLFESWENTKTVPPMKWKAVKAIVTHDPQNFGKSYLVSKIEFTAP
jgi:hypothetical protein